METVYTFSVLSPSPYLSIVIPVRNEEDSLPEFHQELLETLKNLKQSWEILYIENGSTDQTVAILQTLKDAKVFQLKPHPKGYTQITQALLYGIENARADIIVTIDSDGQNDPTDIQKLLENFTDCDFLIGWRQQRQDRISYICVSRLGNVMRKLFHLSPVHDAGCGLRVFKKDVASAFPRHGDWVHYLPDLAAMEGWKVGEVAITHRPRKHGQSKFSSWKACGSLADLLGLWILRIGHDRPLSIFGQWGIVCIALGLLLSLFSSVSIILSLIGIQLLLTGFIGELILRYKKL